MMIRPHQKHPLWLAYKLHRLSGLALVLFLPAHFYVLGLALTDASALDGFLKWTSNPLVKIAEIGLVFLLAVHIFGGLRVLALEFLPWSAKQKTYAAMALATSFFVAISFLMNAI